MQTVTVNGLRVSVVDAHHHVLEAWARVRNDCEFPPILVTFDHHTDCFPAFARHLKCGYDVAREKGESLVRAIDPSNPQTVELAIAQLAHDEHIDCAIRAGIITRAFISLGTDTCGNDYLSAEMTVLDDICVPGCRKKPHTQRCLERHADIVIDSLVLAPRLKEIEKTLGAPLSSFPYIVDVDLDIFRTRAAARPKDGSIFDEIVRGARAVTVAREPECVASEQIFPRQKVTADELEAMILRRIAYATASGT